MTRLPQLEAQLVVAAAGRRRRLKAPRRAAAGVLAAACLVAAALLLAPGSPQRERPVQVAETVPARTLVQARALTALPRPENVAVPDAEIGPVATRIIAQTPYPPGMRDRLNYAGRPRELNHAVEIQSLVEYRSYCLWLKYWLTGTDRPGATAVIAEFPQWPTQRRSNKTAYSRGIVTAAREGDAPRIRREVALNCQGV